METEIELKIGPQGHIYLPKKIREVFSAKLKMMPNAHAAAIYPADANLQAVIASLQLIIEDLKLRLETEEKPATPENHSWQQLTRKQKSSGAEEQ
jgi:hypothetical protein